MGSYDGIAGHVISVDGWLPEQSSEYIVCLVVTAQDADTGKLPWHWTLR